MLRMKVLAKSFMVAALLATGCAHAASQSPIPVLEDAAANEALKIIWAKEMKIYEGRAIGSVDYYINNTSPNFLAWTAGTVKPFRVDQMLNNRANMKGRDQEIIETHFRDFSLSGDTAILFYENKRTRMPDGTVVDQTYDNIHVWQKVSGDWKVLGSMSRPMHKN